MRSIQEGAQLGQGGSSSVTQVIGLAVFILICFAATGIGGLVTTPQIPGWYGGLAKPTWTPPDWIFGPV